MSDSPQDMSGVDDESQIEFERAASTDQEEEARNSLFSLAGGTPAMFYLYMMSDEDRNTFSEKIYDNGGQLVDNPDDADVILVKRMKYRDALRFKYASSRKTYVHMSGFIDSCLESGNFPLNPPAPLKVPGRVPGRRRVPFTAADDKHLADYLGEVLPYKSQGLRGAITTYNDLMHRAEHNEEDEWALDHTAHSWRERYKKHKERIDEMIDAYVKLHPPAENGKGQIKERRATAARMKARLTRASPLGSDGDADADVGALATEEEEEEEEEEPGIRMNERSPPRRRHPLTGGRKRGRSDRSGSEDERRASQHGSPTKKRRVVGAKKKAQTPREVEEDESNVDEYQQQPGEDYLGSPSLHEIAAHGTHPEDVLEQEQAPSPPVAGPSTLRKPVPPTDPAVAKPIRPRRRSLVEVVLPASPRPAKKLMKKTAASRRHSPPRDAPYTRTRARSRSVELETQAAARARPRSKGKGKAIASRALDDIREDIDDSDSAEVENALLASAAPTNESSTPAFPSNPNLTAGDTLVGAEEELSDDDLRTSQRLHSSQAPQAAQIDTLEDILQAVESRLPEARTPAPQRRPLRSAARPPPVSTNASASEEEIFPSPNTRARDERAKRDYVAKTSPFVPAMGTRAAALRAARAHR
ncbi:hypothetical protein BV25DRAFT_1991793 [Artomyces pyxidatus]|uniref:Uncharacterized protein n=1 Tax=Artomyces pyxidatus TaxID=48021 RepID=A0ACB8T197_9AGAM|nr:hypothetical protein BV25DRAFT_1991793 [Artomyces pyxidatus]